MRPIKEIIIHCSATRANWRSGSKTSAKVSEIRKWHTDPKDEGGRGWNDIGYHFIIDRDGTLATGRPLKTIGAHTRGHNSNTLGVCLLGGHGSSENDKFEDNFTPEQDEALRAFIAEQKAKFPAIKKISGHNEYAAKACPGFDVQKWYNAPSKPTIADLTTSAAPSLPPAINAKFEKFADFVISLAAQSDQFDSDGSTISKMGISLADLASWQNVDEGLLTARDLDLLTAKEAKRFYRTQYYTACRCGEMPDRMALAVFDGASQLGATPASKLIQTAFNALGMTADGAPLVVDGIIGRKTMSALQKTDPAVLADAFMDEVENVARQDRHNSPSRLQRLAAVREYISTLPKGSGVRPKTQMKVSDSNLDIRDIVELVVAAKTGNKRAAISKVAELVIDQSEAPQADATAAILHAALGAQAPAHAPLSDDVTTISKGPDGMPPLTPVNAALGETVGRALNGKKSVSGVVGLVATALLPQLGLNGDIVTWVGENTSTLLTGFSLLTGWGFLGKIDKAVRLVGMLQNQR